MVGEIGTLAFLVALDAKAGRGLDRPESERRSGPRPDYGDRDRGKLDERRVEPRMIAAP